MHVEWRGIYPAVTTKFTKDDKIDRSMFQKNIDAQLDAGVHGIVLGGTLGEASTLNTDEKIELVELTNDCCRDRIPVIVNIAEQSTRDAIAYVKAMNERVDGYMLLPPMRYAADSRETITYFKDILEHTDKPVMIYNNPVDYKIEVTIPMFEELLKYDQIQAVKESTRDVRNVMTLRIAFGDRLKILSGVDNLAMESLVMGADGWVAGLVCAFPRETVVIYELIKRGRIDEAREIYQWFIPLLELDVNTKLVQNIKLAETYTGIGTATVRKPRLPLVGKELKEVTNIIETALAEQPDLPEVK